MQSDAGNITAIIIACGVVGAGISGAIVDSTKRFKEVYRVLYVLSVGAFILVGLPFFLVFTVLFSSCHNSHSRSFCSLSSLASSPSSLGPAVSLACVYNWKRVIIAGFIAYGILPVALGVMLG
jgi:hypothetical protein